MTERPAAPRIAPLTSSELDDRQRELLTAVGVNLDGVGNLGGGVISAKNIFATLVRHPGLFKHWLPFGGKLLSGRLPARDRELLILRTGWNCRSDYEWGQHVTIAAACGVTVDEIARVPDGPDAPGWSELDGALLRAADELAQHAMITDDTWKQLAAHYDEQQLVEIPMVVGHYHMVAFTLNALGVPREPGVEGFPDS